MFKIDFNKKRNKFGRILFFTALFLSAYMLIFYLVTDIYPPDVPESKIENKKRKKIAENHYKIGSDYLQKNKFGLWDLYLEGSPYDIGLAEGKLCKELIYTQEEAFVEQINQLVPSPTYLKFLKHGIAWFNSSLDNNIPLEYQQEIYGVSKSASHNFDSIAPPYPRLLNYHAAHDIGHALKDLALVGCTSFGLNLNTPDSNMIIGRNFDFYINERFAENKVVAFVKPEKGHNFMYITWASMIGVVSGMNDQGLTITLNAAKSDIPFKSATPISILAREILQYASNIDEAIAIADKRKTFVSEQLLIGSAKDNKAIVIEKSPSKKGIYDSHENYLVSSNHFQSSTFGSDENNIEYMKQSASVYRQTRCEQLIKQADTFDVSTAVNILRDKKGIDDTDIGIGNEKAMCQMISHHAVVFMPERLKVWVSTPPYQLGEFVCYDLKKTFETGKITIDSSANIAADNFLKTEDYNNYIIYKNLYKAFEDVVERGSTIANYEDLLIDLFRLNPNYYKSYLLAAKYFENANDKENAIKYLEMALKKEFENTISRKEAIEKLKELKKDN